MKFPNLSQAYLALILTLPLSAFSEPSAAKAETSDAAYQTIEWADLIPNEDLDALTNPPEALSNIEDGSEDDSLDGQLRNAAGATASQDAYSQALVSTKIRPELNGRNIRIPGFIVPLEFDDNETITSFFLVPFFGACIHVPPPPPNQVIYAEIEKGTKMESIYKAFWISGKISTTLVENDTATAAYSIDVSNIEPYSD